MLAHMIIIVYYMVFIYEETHLDVENVSSKPVAVALFLDDVLDMF